MMYIAMFMLLVVQPMLGQEQQVEMQQLLPPSQHSSTQAHFYYGGPATVTHARSLHFSLNKQEFLILKTILGCLRLRIGRCSGFLSYDKLHSVDITPDHSTIVIGLKNGTVTTLKQFTSESLCTAALYRREQDRMFPGNNPCVAINSSGDKWASAHSDRNQSTVRVWTRNTLTPMCCTIDDTIEVMLIGSKTAVAGSTRHIYAAQLDGQSLSFRPLTLSFPPGNHELRLGMVESLTDTLAISDKEGKLLKGIELESTPSHN